MCQYSWDGDILVVAEEQNCKQRNTRGRLRIFYFFLFANILTFFQVNILKNVCIQGPGASSGISSYEPLKTSYRMSKEQVSFAKTIKK